jgi:DNA invertase Pin-like site-specific DNA recombinase
MNQEKPIKHLAMYLRISREKKGENVETLANHREMLTEFCKENNYTFEEFGEVISGGKTELEDRVQLQRLLDNIERFDGILCMELSRISRNGLISQTVKQYCIDYDKPILTPYQIYDLANNETDRLMFDVGAMISSHEHGTIGKRSKANKKQMAKQGLHITGAVPYGFVRNNVTKKLEIDDEAAKIIRYIFELHGKGYGSFKIRDILNEEGYKASKGGLFTLPTIKRIIRNPHYKGWTVFHDRRRIKKQGKITYEIVDTVTIKDTHPAIIPPEEWDRANSERIMRAEVAKGIREKPVTKTGVTMLKDLIFCGSCGHKMEIRLDHKCDTTGYNIKRCKYIQPNGKKCPTCGIKNAYVEEYVWNNIAEYKQLLVEKVEELKNSTSIQLEKEKGQKLTNLSKQIKEIETQEKNLLDLALTGLFTTEQIAEKKQELIFKKELLTGQFNQLENEKTSETVKQEINQTQEIINTIDQLPKLNPEEVNQNLKTFISRIHYKREIPEDILKLSTRNEKRKYYPFEIEVEYKI